MANPPITKYNSADNDQLSDRINSLETRHAFQDDIIEKLNAELATHQAEIAELKQQLKLIAGRVKALQPSDGFSDETETPPHY